MGEFIIFIIDCLYLIFTPYISGFLSAYFSWCPKSVFYVFFPLLVFLDLGQRIGYILEKLKLWKR